MAQPFCTGAIHIYCGFGGVTRTSGGITLPNPTPRYLGTAEGFPQSDMMRQWDAVMNDVAGSKLPLDYIYEGEEHVTSVVLTRWDMTVLNLLEAQPVNLGPVRGTTTESDLGMLMQTEGSTFVLWLSYAFAGKAAYPGMDLGRRYPSTILWGPDRQEGGTRANKRHLIFRSYRIYDPSTRSMLLWDTNMDGLPGPN